MNRRLASIAVSLLMCVVVIPACAQQSGLTPPPAPMPARVPPPSPTASSSELLKKADQLYAQKFYLDAMDYYRAALKHEKERSAMIWNKLGIAQLQMSRYNDARKSFEKSIKVDKQYADARNNLGVVYYMRKKYGKAIKYYRQAIALRDAASFHSNMGAAYFSQKDLPRAVAEYQKALALDPNVLDHTSMTGVAAQLSSPSDRAHFSYVLARMFAASGNYDRSLDYLRRAMEDGYKEIKDVYTDKEFAGLRKDPRFAELMASKPVAIPQ